MSTDYPLLLLLQQRGWHPELLAKDLTVTAEAWTKILILVAIVFVRRRATPQCPNGQDAEPARPAPCSNAKP